MIGLDDQGADFENEVTAEKTEEEFTEPDLPEEVFENDFEQENVSPHEIFEDSYSATSQYGDRTVVYSNTEFEHVAARNPIGEYDEADRLLAGVEEVDYSRATDIYARSFRADQRTTSLNQGDDDAFANFDEDSLFESHDQQVLEDEFGDLDHSESTTPFEEYQGAASEEFSSEDVDNEAVNHEGDEAQSFASDGVSEIGRRTVAFDYQNDESKIESFVGERLALLEGPSNLQEVALDHFPIRMGRDIQNHVQIDDSNVSRFHCEIRNEHQGIRLVDLGSTNGIKVNGAQVADRYLQDHDILQVGDAIFEFLLPGSEKRGLSDIPSAHETQLVSRAPQKNKFQNFKSRFQDKKKLRVLAAALFLMVGAVLAFKNQIASAIKGGSQEVVIAKAGQEMQALQNDLKSMFEAEINAIPAEEVKKQLLQRLEVMALVPPQLKANIENIPAPLLKVFVEDPRFLQAYLKSGGNQEVLMQRVRLELQAAQQRGENDRAVEWAFLLKNAYPDDPLVQQQYDELLEQTKVIQFDRSQVEVSDEDRMKFENYMTDFQSRADALIDELKFADALSFARTVKTRVIDLIRKQPSFEPLAESAIAEWSSKIRFLESKVEEQKQLAVENKQKIVEGDRLITEIRSYMERGQVHEASMAVERFFREFSDHPEIQMVRNFRMQLDQAIKLAFQGVETEIESLSTTENYKLGWEKLYLFMDMIPNYPPAREVLASLEDRTRARAAQYYQKARVFEFETNDLVAAEQYYKKSLETSNPRGDLADKSQRGLTRVQRKMIK